MKSVFGLLVMLCLLPGCSNSAPPSAMVPPQPEKPVKSDEPNKLSESAPSGKPVADDGWQLLFDGKTLDGWKANENPESFKVEDGALVAHATQDRSHLFYVGPIADANFKNFEFQADVKTTPGSNSGIYFHTKFQDSGWPEKGYEAQVNNSHTDPKRTGGLYGIQDNLDPVAKDDEWFNERVIVRGKHIQIFVDGKKVTDYVEPENPEREGRHTGKLLSSGTFALQAHDPQSTVYYKNIQVKLLPDDAP